MISLIVENPAAKLNGKVGTYYNYISTYNIIFSVIINMLTDSHYIV